MSNQGLVCIGGPMDGDPITVKSGLKAFSCPMPWRPRVSTENETDNWTRDTFPVESEQYFLESFAGKEACFDYWRHEGTSVEVCIQKLLPCYANQIDAS